MTQSRALDVLKTGANVFLTGEPGAGKTYVINQYIAWLEAAGLSVAVTASTGIAATHIGGMTIHSWSGIGIRDQLTAYDLDYIASNEKTVRRVRSTHVLVIDEISMLDGKVLDMVDVVMRTIRQSSEPFGGVQVVCVGDFFQLPPVTRQGDVVRYAFESRAWELARPIVCYLSEQHRQADELLLGLLGSIRKNLIEDDHYSLLREQTTIAYEHIEPTRLYTHNVDVDVVNHTQLAALSGASKSYKMSGAGNKTLVASLIKNCLSPEQLVLKEEAMVMCTKNNFEAGYVNGTMGRVVGFSDGLPIIETGEGKRITIEPVTWEVVEDKKVLASIEQLPLRLAWAITVHKSQGMSLDAIEVDLSKAFVYGQGYVALSRVRSLEGLKVLGMHQNALQVDPKVVQRDERFQSESFAAEETFEAMDETELVEMHERFVKANGGKIPTAEEVSTPRGSQERLQKESTYAITKAFLLEKKTVSTIAKERNLSESTVWSHIEKLAGDKELTIETLSHLEPGNWSKISRELFDIMEQHGTERLKVIYEAAGEKYDYNTIRLARIIFGLEQRARNVDVVF